MQGADFVFFLQDKKNRFWKTNESGNVILSSAAYPLRFSPDGWQETGIKNIRSKKYWGIDRVLSTSFKYVEDAGKILKHIFYSKGLEESVYLTICEQKLAYDPGVSYGYWYKQIFKAEIDLSTFKHTGAIVTCNTAEEGLAKHLKANENTIYEFPLETDDAINVKMDGINLAYKRSYIIPESQEITGVDNFYLGMSEFSREGTLSSVGFFDVSAQPTTSYPNNAYFLKTTTHAQTIRVRGTIRLFMNESCTPFIRLELNDGVSGSSTNSNLYTAAHTSGQTVDAVIDHTFTIPAGHRGHINVFGGDPEATDPQFTIMGVDLEFTYDYRHPTTYIKAFRPQYLFSELIKKMTDGDYSGEDSPYFGELQHFDKVFTSGDGIRGLEGAKLKISFAQFFDFWDTFDAVGIREINKQILFDRKKELTDDLNTINLGTVSRLSIELDTSYPFNELAIGYPDIKNESGILNGKNEVNTTSFFSMGTTKAPKKLDKVSHVKASCYEIEDIRISFLNQESTDNKNDNEAYVLHIVNDATPEAGDIPEHYELDRSYNDHVTGVDEAATVFNLELSPKNNLIRSSDYLHSCQYKSDNRKLSFTSALRNSNMSYLNGSDVRVESADVSIGDLDDPFFQPVIISFETDAPIDLLDLLDANPLQCFQFDFEGVSYKGIPIETGINPKSNKKQTYQLLSHPDNDLKQLVNYFG